jgi:hypothetical protein
MGASGCAGISQSRDASKASVVVESRRHEPRPSRAQWGLVVVGPAEDGVRHPVAYYPSAGARVSRPDLRAYHDPEAQVLAALSGEEPGNWSGANAKALVAEPVLAGWETAWLPVKLVVNPPWVMVVD